MAEQNPYDNLTFEDFRRRAVDPSLSRHERVGFPDAYREGKEDLIFDDIVVKLRLDAEGPLRVLEIGPGCSGLPLRLTRLCADGNHELAFVDSVEMLAQLPDEAHVTKHPGCFPNVPSLDMTPGSFDRILAYSVLQYPHEAGVVWEFLDAACALLAEGGWMLLGDLPNASMRSRFFASPAGIAFHQAFTGTDEEPNVASDPPPVGRVDDDLVLGILTELRSRRLHAWVLPQADGLPMANRREDLLVARP